MPNRYRVLVTGSSVREDLFEPLVAIGCEIDNPPGVLTEAELGEHLAQADAYLFGGDEYASGAALEKAENLKVVAFLGVGYESFVDTPAATARSIPVTNTPGTLTRSVSELSLAMLLDGARKVTHYSELFRDGASGEEEKQHDVSAMTIGIVGLGEIGSDIARILRSGFGCDVRYFSRTRKEALEEELGLKFHPLQGLMGACDAVIVMTPGNDSTRGLLGREGFGAARDGLILINTARPDVVDPEALEESLGSGRIGFAAFDNFYEDDAGQRLLDGFGSDRLLVTGHIGSLTHEARDGMAIKAVQSIVNILQTGDDAYVVNR